MPLLGCPRLAPAARMDLQHFANSATRPDWLGSCGPYCEADRRLDNTGMVRLASSRLPSLCAAVLLLGSCAAPRTQSLAFAVRQTPRTDADAVFEASESALLDLNYHIDRRDKAAGVLSTKPALGAARRRTDGRPVVLSSRSDTRRVAEVRVERGNSPGETVSVYCRVIVQEQTTQEHRVFDQDQRGYDAPTETAIDREAGRTTEQNTVWRAVGRDREAESRILSAIMRRTGETRPGKSGANPS